MEKMYLIPGNVRDALISFLASQMPMVAAEEPVSHLRSLQEYHPPMTDDEAYRELLECRLSGQIDNARWLAHLEDDGFRRWLDLQITTKKETE